MALWQFQVSPKPDQPDTHGLQTAAILRDFGVTSVQTVRTARLFTVDLPGDPEAAEALPPRIADQLLTDPVAEVCAAYQQDRLPPAGDDTQVVEVHLKPGVMDNVANSALLALRDMGIQASSVRTARRFELSPVPTDQELPRIRRLLGNDCIEHVIFGTKPILPPARPPAYDFRLRHVTVRDLDDAGLEQLSREGHLFLSLDEMHAIRDHYRTLERDPTDLELETLAQTWSEHCVHKTLKSRIEYRGAPFPSARAPKSPQPRSGGTPEFIRKYDNLLKDTIARATDELIQSGRGPECLSVFKDNAGIIALDDQYGIAFKVETHNHPSAIEPYGGAATGIGGVIRDVLGCGLGAKPIANTDVFCVAPPDWPVDAVPKGVTHPRTILSGIVAGVRDYGNRMGIPTVNGAIHFDPRYLGNPLVYCGCAGLLPRDRIDKEARPGDAIVLIGGRTGRDGIHGATFSSAELTDTHVDEFAHAVQIGNPIEEKKILDVILQARDDVRPGSMQSEPLYSAITDCGAGGLSSAVGEMAAEIGAEVNLETVPLKYAGLRYDEIWISEAQERMVLAVPPERLDALLDCARSEDVEATVIGRFTDTGRLQVRYERREVGDLDMHFLHHGLPKTVRQAEWSPREATRSAPRTPRPEDFAHELMARLADPNTASKHWVVRQYDHEVQGRSVVKPLVGPCDGPSDAAVLRPRLDSNRGIALGCGLATDRTCDDPYWMAVAAIDEAVRNTVCVGGDPTRTAILDNFCWPGVDDPRSLGALVRACQACYDVATTYGLPFISGKDSLNNEFALDPAGVDMVRRVIQQRTQQATPHPTKRAGPSPARSTPIPDAPAALSDPVRHNRLPIPYTLLISALSLIEDVNRCITAAPRLIDDKAVLLFAGTDAEDWQDVDLDDAARLHANVASCIASGAVIAAHDCSDGGPAVAVAEMAIASGLETRYLVPSDRTLHDPFAAPPSGYILQAADVAAVETALADLQGIHVRPIARLSRPVGEPTFAFLAAGNETPLASAPLSDLRRAWTAPLDW